MPYTLTEEQKQETTHHTITAPNEGTIMGIFWDVENTSVPVQYVENFAENVRSNMKNFHRKLFYAAAAQAYANVREIPTKMKNANIDFFLAPEGKDEADDWIRDEIKEFCHKYRENSWIVLISTDAKAFNPIVKTIRNPLVLIYDDGKDASGGKLKKMLKSARHKFPIRLFTPK